MLALREAYSNAGLPSHQEDGGAGGLLDQASQKELQVVCGGLVYAAMFKRPLLGALNQVWA